MSSSEQTTADDICTALGMDTERVLATAPPDVKKSRRDTAEVRAAMNLTMPTTRHCGETPVHLYQVVRKDISNPLADEDYQESVVHDVGGVCNDDEDSPIRVADPSFRHDDYYSCDQFADDFEAVIHSGVPEWGWPIGTSPFSNQQWITDELHEQMEAE